MVRYFQQPSARTPRIGVRYTQKVKSDRAIASVFDIGVPAVSESRRNLVMKIVRIPFIP